MSIGGVCSSGWRGEWQKKSGPKLEISKDRMSLVFFDLLEP